MQNKDMDKMDYDKFIKFLVENANTNDFKNALAMQGLYFDNDELKQIEYRPKFKIGDTITDGSLTFTVKDLDLFNNSYTLENNFGYKTKLIFSYVDKEYHPSIEKDIKSKFKVGDWITNDLSYPMQISSIDDGLYYTHNDTIGGDIESMDKEYHLWTLEDARDGDVLVHNGCTFIFMGIKNGIVQALEKNLLDGVNPVCFGDPDKDGDYYPATKEQRDLLFKKMHDAGYKWDAEKKELKKIKKEHLLLSDYFNNEYERGRVDAINEMQKSWAEDDKKHIANILTTLLIEARNAKTKPYRSSVESDIDWIYSLKNKWRPQSKEWCPSDEQLEIIDRLLTNKAMDEHVAKILRELKEQLNEIKK